MEFLKPTLEDKKRLSKYYENVPYMNCELTFGNFYLWAEHYDTTYAVVDDVLIHLTEYEGKRYISMPIGFGNIKEAILKVARAFKEDGYDFYMRAISEDMFRDIDNMFPDCFTIEYERDYADYVYSIEKMAELKGKKMHGKRNHIANFMRNNEWSFEPITDENVDECIEMAEIWRVNNGCEENPEKSYELCVSINALKEREELGLIGGLIRANGTVVAFTLGEPVNSEVFNIHIEKAFNHVQGAYPIINQQFILNYLMDYKYVNREEDVGDLGLRKAKLSYYPEILLEKGVLSITDKGRQVFFGE